MRLSTNKPPTDRSRRGAPQRPTHLEVVDVSEDASHIEKIREEEEEEEYLPIRVQEDL